MKTRVARSLFIDFDVSALEAIQNEMDRRASWMLGEALGVAHRNGSRLAAQPYFDDMNKFRMVANSINAILKGE